MKLLAVLAFVAAFDAGAQMYKCTNERGVVQYTDKPSAGCKEVTIRGSPPISGSIQPPDKDLAKEEANFRRRQLERESAADRDRQVLAQRCTEMRREHSLLSTTRRVVRLNDKGEPTFMEEADRDQRVADLQRELARCP